ncbi:MAG TPA: hypothetical protein VJK51_02700 [Candidatus Nanoarchaeia archaeon]|nr:hypothetical protein [Candidatus Nanoarchaeia archaeon]
MEQKPVTLEMLYAAIQTVQRELQRIEQRLPVSESIVGDDEGELTEETEAALEKARSRPLSQAIPHKEVVKRFLS